MTGKRRIWNSSLEFWRADFGSGLEFTEAPCGMPRASRGAFFGPFSRYLTINIARVRIVEFIFSLAEKEGAVRSLILLVVVLGIGQSVACAESVRIRMLVTGYCPCKECCGPKACGITASGKSVSANGGKFCAAPKNFNFGARVSVPGYNGGKPIPVLDRGGAIKGRHLDLFFPTHEEARRWGKRWVEVVVHE